jgi:hypothetical protein
MREPKTWVFLLFLIWITQTLDAQEVPQSVNNKGIYEFLDELANIHIITINSAIKPYSRLFISIRLKEAEEKREQLNSRQQKELDFYKLDFGKEDFGEKGRKGEGEMGRKGETERGRKRFDLLYYSDSLFSLTINPILGGEVFSNSSGKATYWRNGVEARGYIGKWGFYASLRDNHENPLLGKPEYLTKSEGGHLKGNTGANIFGGNNPTYVQLKLHISPVKWFDFNYFHGWLNSMVVDSNNSYWITNSYGKDYREVYHKKFIAANMFTFIPLKNLNVSAGNSIVYNDENVNPAYLIPLFFYKSVDHSLTSGIDNMNSQMFLDISSRQIKNLHLYGTLFIDELSVSRFTMKDQWNFFSYKAGFRVTDFPVANLSFTTEFTYTYPLSFQHYVPTLTFENAGYNLGHYLKDNTREWYIALDYRPIRTLNFNLFFSDAIRGPDYTALGVPRVGNPPLVSVEWQNTSYGIKASYQVINDLYTWFSFTNSDIRGDETWSPVYFFGKKNTLNAGLTFGF